jgi:cytochrome c
MRRNIFVFVILAFSLSIVFSGSKTDPVKEKKVAALVEKGAAFIKKNGIESAVKAFQNPDGGFVDGEFYIFLYDFDGNALVVGTNTSLIGKNLLNLVSEDRNGNKVFQVKELINIAKTKGQGWFEWSWQNPQTKKFGPKRGYAKKIVYNKIEYMIGSGYYLGDED